MTSPWKKLDQIEPANLEDIMSEQVAIDLQEKEDKIYAAAFGQSNVSEATGSGTYPEKETVPFEDDLCQSDAVLAAVLQKQFDKEFDEQLQIKENIYNRNMGRKVNISFSNYRRTCGE